MADVTGLTAAELQRASFELEVFNRGQAIGILEKAGDSFIFQYYPKVDVMDFVSLLMPVRTQPYLSGRNTVLPPVFDMNLPEGSLRKLLVQRYSKVVSGFNDLALLALVGRTTIGRLTFGGPRLSAAAPLDVGALMESEDTDQLLHQLYQSDAALSGIAGAQPKVIAAITPSDLAKFSDDLAGNASVRGTIKTDNVIVKTSGEDAPWLAANEYHCLRAAKLSGLDTPDTWLFQGGQILVVSRFDRASSKDSTLEALGAEDFCALNGMVSSDKYSSSYERVFKILSDYVEPSRVHQDRLTLFHSLALSCVLRNGDAHLKNFTLLYDAGPILNTRLSPVYDICTTNAYLTKDMLALNLAGSKRYPTKKKLDQFARQQCGLLPETIEHTYDAIEAGVNKAAQELTSYAEQYPEFQKRIGRVMLELWLAGLDSLGRHGRF